jgi:hypothetical protein
LYEFDALCQIGGMEQGFQSGQLQSKAATVGSLETGTQIAVW